jgi:hypothetical protein
MLQALKITERSQASQFSRSETVRKFFDDRGKDGDIAVIKRGATSRLMPKIKPKKGPMKSPITKGIITYYFLPCCPRLRYFSL